MGSMSILATTLTLRIQGGGYYTPQVGDEVVLRGPISEYYNLTEIGNPEPAERGSLWG